MSFVPVPTVAVGDLWTAAMQNQYIKANMEALSPAIFTAKGQLVAASIGGPNKVDLVANEPTYEFAKLQTDVGWTNTNLGWKINPCYYNVSSSGSVSIPNATETVLNMPTIVGGNGYFDYLGGYITIGQKMGGLYMINTRLLFEPGSAANMLRRTGVICSKAGSFYSVQVQDVDLRQVYLNMNVFVELVVGETVCATALHYTGVAINALLSTLTIVRMQ